MGDNLPVQNSIWNQNHTHGMLNVFPAVVAVKTSLNKAPRSTVATIVNPTREKMAPRASFLRMLIRTPQRIHTGNPMTGAWQKYAG